MVDNPARDIATGFVWFAALHIIFIPVKAIMTGALWGPEAFIGGAVIVASVMFLQAYEGLPDDV